MKSRKRTREHFFAGLSGFLLLGLIITDMLLTEHNQALSIVTDEQGILQNEGIDIESMPPETEPIPEPPTENEEKVQPIEDTVIDSNGKLSDVTIEKLTETEIITSVNFMKVKYPLVSELPDEDIYLYGADDGVILRKGNQLQCFEWYYLTPRFVLPWMKADDFDNDGIEELLCVLYVGSGTGVAISELHMLEPLEADPNSNNELQLNSTKINHDNIVNPGIYREIVFRPEDYVNQLEKNVLYRYYKDESRFTFLIGYEEYPFATPEVFREYEFDGIYYGDIVFFDYQDEIRIIAGPGFQFIGIAPPQYFGTVSARVNYNEEGFLLDDFSVHMDELISLRD